MMKSLKVLLIVEATAVFNDKNTVINIEKLSTNTLLTIQDTVVFNDKNTVINIEKLSTLKWQTTFATCSYLL